MDQFLAYVIVGLTTAAIYAVIGSGLVLTYTTTGVFNFAHGAAGMLAAFAYWQLTIGWGWPVPVAPARWIWSPNVSRTLPAFFASAAPLHIGPASVTWHQMTTMIVAVAVAVGLRVLLYQTRTGTEMRATVDDRALARLTGADPNRAHRVAWILSTQLAAVGGILIAPELTL